LIFDEALWQQKQNQDTDAGWCDIARGQIINSQSGAKFCAIHMPKYQIPEPTEAE